MEESESEPQSRVRERRRGLDLGWLVRQQQSLRLAHRAAPTGREMSIQWRGCHCAAAKEGRSKQSTRYRVCSVWAPMQRVLLHVTWLGRPEMTRPGPRTSGFQAPCALQPQAPSAFCICVLQHNWEPEGCLLLRRLNSRRTCPSTVPAASPLARPPVYTTDESCCGAQAVHGLGNMFADAQDPWRWVFSIGNVNNQPHPHFHHIRRQCRFAARVYSSLHRRPRPQTWAGAARARSMLSLLVYSEMEYGAALFSDPIRAAPRDDIVVTHPHPPAPALPARYNDASL